MGKDYSPTTTGASRGAPLCNEKTKFTRAPAFRCGLYHRFFSERKHKKPLNNLLTTLFSLSFSPQVIQNASQKEMRDRIASVGSTKKITDAMKLVAAAKVRKRKMPSSTRVRSLNNSSRFCLPSTASCKAKTSTRRCAPSDRLRRA